MRVFVSWSKPRSQAVAVALHDWLRTVLQNVDPWISTETEAGARWGAEITQKLEESKFGILCVTPENPGEPWLNFEAGAIGKVAGDSKVVPYLLEMTPSQVPQGPLSQFQAKQANKEGTRDLLASINKAIPDGKGLTEAVLAKTFDKWWPDLEEKLNEATKMASPAKPEKPSPEKMLEEVLELARRAERRASSGDNWGRIPTNPRRVPLEDIVGEAVLPPWKRTKRLSKEEFESLLESSDVDAVVKALQAADPAELKQRVGEYMASALRAERNKVVHSGGKPPDDE